MSKTHFSVIKYEKELTTAFQQDCEQFLLEFEKLKSFKFQDFSSVWQEMSFTYVYGDFRYVPLIKLLVENFFLIVKKFIIYPKNLFTQVGALFLLYGLYYKQPIKNLVSIRLTIEEYECISKVLHEMKKINEMEPLFIFTKLKVDNAFDYVANRDKFDLLSKSINLFKKDTFQIEHMESSIIKYKNVYESTINGLETLCKEYDNSFKELAAKYPNLQCIPSNIIEELKKTYSIKDESDKSTKS